MEDKRKKNGGHSTKSNSLNDKRKRMLMDIDKLTDDFFDKMKKDCTNFYELAYRKGKNDNVKHGEYYVYFHYHNEELVYIGKGKNGRMDDSFRSYDEHSLLIKNDLINSVVIANNLSEEIALMIEASLIIFKKPKYNIQGNH